MANDTDRLRLAVLGIVVVSLFAALFARLWYLQVMDSESFRVAAEANQVKFVYEEAPRGRVLDRQGRVLVDNSVAEVVVVSRVDVPDMDVLVGRLAALLGMSVQDVRERLADQRYSQYKPVPVAEGIEPWKVVYLREHREEFPGVSVVQLAERSYPHGSLAAHVLGYVGEINDTELDERRTRGYRLGDSIGKTGVERTYEADLRGAVGVTKLEVNSSNRVLRTLDEQPPVQGHDVQLTVDLDVQRVAEESLMQGLEAARNAKDRANKPFVAPAGSVVVLDPRDGSVLAMASYPTFEPAAFVDGVSVETFRALQDPAGAYPLNNRAVQGQYAPGSVFKLVTALAGLRKGVIDERTTLEDTGTYKLRSCRGNKCVFKNAGSRAYGRVDLRRAIAVSSDVYFYDLGARFWFERETFGDGIQEVAEDLGFGTKTGVPLPGELPGRIPDPETRRRLNEQAPKAFPNADWYAGDNLNLAIGQGETVVTPVQMARAYATVANGGMIHRPRLVAQVLDAAGEVVREEAPLVERRVDIAPNHRAVLLAGLRGATTVESGTAVQAFAGFPGSLAVGGKTGTAQVSKKQDTALFVGVAPIDDPQYVVAVTMEEAGFGGSAAAPVARRILAGLANQPLGPVTLAGGVD